MSNPSLLCVPYRFKTSKLYSQIPDSGLGDFVVTRATTPTAGQATRVNAAGLIELVADNVPRLDYPLGGITAGCPALLVEPSAQNIVQSSEAFDDAYWAKVRCTASPNQTISPNGALTAEKLIMNNGVSPTVADTDGLLRNGVITSAAYRFSIFAKAAEFTGFKVRENLVNGNFMDVNLTNGAITNPDTAQFISPLAENYGNGWYRISWTSPTTTNLNKYSIRVGSTGNGTSGIFIWGYQVETGSAATSYIPTTTAAITRGAEVVDRTGISSLMGQTEGTFYLDMSYFAKGGSGATLWLYIVGTPTSNNIGLAVVGTSVRSIVNGQSDILSTPSTANGVKIAWGYDGSGVVCFVNGVQYNLPTGGNQIITSMNRCVIDMSSAGGTRMADVRIRAVELHPTRLPNTGPNSLQSLTQ